jgi:hypothetical protein
MYDMEAMPYLSVHPKGQYSKSVLQTDGISTQTYVQSSTLLRTRHKLC